MRISFLAPTFLTALALVPAAVGHAQVIFSKIADDGTQIPGSGDEFETFWDPALDGGNVAFRGSELGPLSAPKGIYAFIGGALGLAADDGTSIPGSPNKDFVQFGDPTLDGSSVAFSGGNVAEALAGVFENSAGSLFAPANQDTAIPGSQTTFGEFGNPSFDGGKLAFHGASSGGSTDGIYDNVAGSLFAVADLSTQIPGKQRSFREFGDPSFDAGAVAFRGGNVSENLEGIFTNAGAGVLFAVADRSTPIPGGSRSFSDFGEPSLDAGVVAFRGGSGSEQGIFSNAGPQLFAIVDQSTPVPGGSGTLEDFGDPSLDAGNVAFRALSSESGDAGIYVHYRGALSKVIDASDELDGRDIVDLNLGREALSGNRVAFRVGFIDGAGIYVATLPEPAGASGVALLVLSVLARPRRRRRACLARYLYRNASGVSLGGRHLGNAPRLMSPSEPWKTRSKGRIDSRPRTRP